MKLLKNNLRFVFDFLVTSVLFFSNSSSSNIIMQNSKINANIMIPRSSLEENEPYRFIILEKSNDFHDNSAVLIKYAVQRHIK